MDEEQTTNSISQTDTSAQADGQESATEVPESEEEIKRKMEAILEMEGEEGRLKREKEEKEKEEAEKIGKIEEEKTTINSKLEEIRKQKEELEIKWIDLRDKKNDLQKLLNPILADEMSVEKDVQAKNQEEHATDDPKIRQGFERERQILELKRQEIEKSKWVIEDKMTEINAIMEENKTKFQAVEKEEFQLKDRIKELDEQIKSIKTV